MTAHDGGRWHGRLTSQPLPEDPTIEALDRLTRERIAGSWQGRSAAERRAAASFRVIREALVTLSADTTIVDLATRAIDDELRHAEICRVVASRYAGRDLPAPPLLPFEVPALPGAAPDLRATLHILGNCTLNETTATVFLEACLERATGVLVRAALRELLADDVDHARIGWAHYASLSPERRREVDPWLGAMVEANAVVWRAAACADDERLAEHGWLSREVVEDALVTSVRELVIPGLARFGGDTASLQGWL